MLNRCFHVSLILILLLLCLLFDHTGQSATLFCQWRNTRRLLRGYYSLEDLYILLKSVIGSSDNFKDFVLENYQHVNDVSDFALLAHMSVRNFQRKFKEEFKWPVREWLNERRAERILRDIRNTDKSIAEIATSYGFATASYFTVFCKQYFGMTPSELRRRSKQTATKCRE